MINNNFSEHLTLSNFAVNDTYWNRYISLVLENVIPYQYDALCDNIPGAPKSYCIENFVKAAAVVEKLGRGEKVPVFPADKWVYDDNNAHPDAFHGWVFQDTDLYKWIEAVGFALFAHKDDMLEKTVDESIDLICRAQLPSGYLDTLYIINDRDKIFTNLRDYHELYCFGHLTQAAVSYYNATGKRKLLDCACRFADLIGSVFGESKKEGYPGHEIAEMALMQLFELTGERKYADTARFFVEHRGTKPYYFDTERDYKRSDDSLDYYYNQAHLPPKQQTEAVGHAVRGVYLYSAMADISKAYEDEALFAACKSIWSDIVKRKMYITGGIGATVDGEAFSFAYDLPNDLAYSETCAAIGLCFFARRMLEIEPIGEYADVLERALYNTVLAGMAQDGKSFFYVNPLEVLPEASRKDSRKRHVCSTRQKWFGCACCPPNIARMVTSLGEYCYSENERTLFAHLFVGGKIVCEKATVTVTSSYLETGDVSYKIAPNRPFTFAVRIPGWCNNYSINVPYETKNGYAYIDIDHETEVKIHFEILPTLVRCSNRVRANVGKVAVMRGPIVYCMESADNGENLQLICLKRQSRLLYRDGKVLAEGYREAVDSELYIDAQSIPQYDNCTIKFVPYSTWGNRGEGEMSVYVRVV